MDITDDPFGLGDWTSHPRGCFFGTNLAHNSNEASTIQCVRDHQEGCICRAVSLAGTTTSVVQTSSMTATTSTTSSSRFLSTKMTSTSTTLKPSSLCTYVAHANTAVSKQGTGGQKLKRVSFGSEKAYLDACKASCNAQSKCNGFVDDPTDRRGRMCKPKTAQKGYRKLRKTFYLKGPEC